MSLKEEMQNFYYNITHITKEDIVFIKLYSLCMLPILILLIILAWGRP